MIGILIAESGAVYGEGLEACLARQPDMRVVGRIDHGREVRSWVPREGVTLLMLDTLLPGLEGFALLKEIRAARPTLPILLMAGTQDVGWLLRGIRAGANGVVPKDASVEQVSTAVRRIHQGHPYIGEALAEKMILFYQRHEVEPLEERLSPREFEVMRYLCSGLKLSEIARALHLSHQTITTHRRHILEKTGMRTTAEIIRYGILRGLGDDAEGPPRCSPASRPQAQPPTGSALPGQGDPRL